MHKKDWIKRECNGCKQYNAECRSGVCFWQQITRKITIVKKTRDNIPFIFILWRTGKTYIRLVL